MDEKGISQIDFSRLTGISQSTISDWKRKRTNPSADKIMLICDVLNVSPQSLLQDINTKDFHVFDSIIINKDTLDYEIMVEVASLDVRHKERVLGYINALTGK
jgi:transcriptional regulator with XRE-family HTH domain